MPPSSSTMEESAPNSFWCSSGVRQRGSGFDAVWGKVGEGPCLFCSSWCHSRACHSSGLIFTIPTILQSFSS
jgi:hypothetical protein